MSGCRCFAGDCPWYRRMVAAALVAVAVITGIAAARPAPPATIDVLVAATDLPGGSRLTRADVTTTALPVELVPAGALLSDGLAAVDSRVLAGPVRAGEPLTDPLGERIAARRLQGE